MLRQRAPVEITTERLFSDGAARELRPRSAPLPGTSVVGALQVHDVDVVVAARAASSASANFGPSVSLTEMKFSMPMVSSTWPPKRSDSHARADALARRVDGGRRAGRAAADDQHVERRPCRRSSSLRARRRWCRAWRGFPRGSCGPGRTAAPFRNTVGTAMIWRSFDFVLEQRAVDHGGLDARVDAPPSGSAPARRPGSSGRSARCRSRTRSRRRARGSARSRRRRPWADGRRPAAAPAPAT